MMDWSWKIKELQFNIKMEFNRYEIEDAGRSGMRCLCLCSCVFSIQVQLSFRINNAKSINAHFYGLLYDTVKGETNCFLVLLPLRIIDLKWAADSVDPVHAYISMKLLINHPNPAMDGVVEIDVTAMWRLHPWVASPFNWRFFQTKVYLKISDLSHMLRLVRHFRLSNAKSMDSTSYSSVQCVMCSYRRTKKCEFHLWIVRCLALAYVYL